jgi:predicted chitinase
VNVDTLLATMPGLSRKDAERYLPLMEAAMRENDVTNEMRARMWLAQVGHESGSLVYFEELASGAAYEGRADLGNTQPGDGKKYKGRGPIQVTGRSNYTNAGNGLRLPLVDKPEMAADPTHAFRVSGWWWKANGLNPISDTGDVVAATKRINGGTNGLSDRQSRYELARKQGSKVIVTGGSGAAPPSSAVPPASTGTAPPLHVDYFGKSHNSAVPDVRVWQQRMKDRGWTIGVDGQFGPQSDDVCRKFQKQVGVTADGLVGPTTWNKSWTAPVT